MVDRAHARDGDVVDLGVQPLDRDIQIAIERELDRVLERQPDHGPRLPGRLRLRHLVGRTVPHVFRRLFHQLSNPLFRHLSARRARHHDSHCACQHPVHSTPLHCIPLRFIGVPLATRDFPSD